MLSRKFLSPESPRRSKSTGWCSESGELLQPRTVPRARAARALWDGPIFINRQGNGGPERENDIPKVT